MVHAPGRATSHASISRRGEVLDNAAMESWNSAFKFECGERFDDNEIAEAKTFDYIEVFWGSTYASEDYQDVLAAHGITCDNRKRRHSAIGMVSPAEFERMFTQRQAA